MPTTIKKQTYLSLMFFCNFTAVAFSSKQLLLNFLHLFGCQELDKKKTAYFTQKHEFNQNQLKKIFFKTMSCPLSLKLSAPPLGLSPSLRNQNKNEKKAKCGKPKEEKRKRHQGNKDNERKRKGQGPLPTSERQCGQGQCQSSPRGRGQPGTDQGTD